MVNTEALLISLNECTLQDEDGAALNPLLPELPASRISSGMDSLPEATCSGGDAKSAMSSILVSGCSDFGGD